MIVELVPFDIATSAPGHLVATSPFWSALPRLTRTGKAKLIAVNGKICATDAMNNFQKVAVPVEELPPGVAYYRAHYEQYLRDVVSDSAYIRSYLVVDVDDMDAANFCSLLAGYGFNARPFSGELPLPFAQGREYWSYIDAGGFLYAMMASRPVQHGAIYPRSLHRLFSLLDFPLWVILGVQAFSEGEAARVLRRKSVAARFAPRRSHEDAQEIGEVQSSIVRLRNEMERGSATLHLVNLFVLYGAPDRDLLKARGEMIRAAAPMEVVKVEPPGDAVRRVFSSRGDCGSSNGTLASSPGVALLVGSALSYRRRAETRGIMLGIDRNQSPVILDVFDPRNPSYNAVIIGQTGSGKTFAALLLMLRHLLMGTRLIIVDPQGVVDLSFLGSNVVGRYVLGGRGASVNVLDVWYPELGMQVESTFAMLSLLGVVDGRSPLQRAVMDDVLLEIYSQIWGVDGVPVPTLDAVQRRLFLYSSSFPTVRDAAQMLAYMLSPYVRGSYMELFGQPTSVDFSLQYPVNIYDVSRLPQRELGGNLRAVLLSILVAGINQGIRRRRSAGDTAPILFFVDEMGMLMRDPVIASHVSGEYKTARARRVGMVVADQDLHSLLGPRDASGLHHGAPIMANAALKFIFHQEESEKERIANAFPGLPVSLLESIFSLPRGVCLAQLPDDLLIMGIRPSGFEAAVLSSQLHDRERAAKAVAQAARAIALMQGERK